MCTVDSPAPARRADESMLARDNGTDNGEDTVKHYDFAASCEEEQKYRHASDATTIQYNTTFNPLMGTLKPHSNGPL